MFEGLRFGDLGLEVLRIERLRFRGFGYGISCEVQGLNSRAHVQDNLGPMFVGLGFRGLELGNSRLNVCRFWGLM